MSPNTASQPGHSSDLSDDNSLGDQLDSFAKTDAANDIDQSSLLEDVTSLETEIELLKRDYEALTLGLEDDPNTEAQQEPWKIRAARWALGKPKKQTPKVEPLVMSKKEQERIVDSALHVQKKIEILVKLRDQLLAKIDAETRSEHESKSNVVSISDFIAKKSKEVLKFAKKELSLEAAEQFLSAMKTRFEDQKMTKLHKGIAWADVEKSLRADPEAMFKLNALDEKGHEMNVFGEKNGEIIFRSAQRDVTKIAPEHRTIMYDKKAQTDNPELQANGNAVDIAASMGVDLADKELYEQLRVKNGLVWLKTGAVMRKIGFAYIGAADGSYHAGAHLLTDHDVGSFCPTLRVKKA